MRRALVLAALATLVVASSAAAWDRLTTDTLRNIVDPATLRLADGSELVVYQDSQARKLTLVRSRGEPQVLVSGWPSVGGAQLVQRPDKSVLLFFSGTSPGASMQGVLQMSSSDGGKTWSAPTATPSKDLAGVGGAAVRKDGTPLFSQSKTGAVNVYQGGAVHNVFPFCCGYGETLTVDSTGLAQIAFWSNAKGIKGYVYGSLDASGALAGDLVSLTGGAESIGGLHRVPLVSDASGNTFMAWRSGYPTAKALHVTPFRSGKPVRDLVVSHGPFRSDDPRMALAVDPDGKLWVAWSQGAAVWAARSRTSAKSLGAAVKKPFAGDTAWHLEAIAQSTGLDVIANLGTLSAQRFLPGLSVRVTKKQAVVLDDGFPVAGATLTGGGRSVKTDSRGRASLAGLHKGTVVTVTSGGYTPTRFKTR